MIFLDSSQLFDREKGLSSYLELAEKTVSNNATNTFKKVSSNFNLMATPVRSLEKNSERESGRRKFMKSLYMALFNTVFSAASKYDDQSF